eukprot:UN05447
MEEDKTAIKMEDYTGQEKNSATNPNDNENKTDTISLEELKKSQNETDANTLSLKDLNKFKAEKEREMKETDDFKYLDGIRQTTTQPVEQTTNHVGHGLSSTQSEEREYAKYMAEQEIERSWLDMHEADIAKRINPDDT